MGVTTARILPANEAPSLAGDGAAAQAVAPFWPGKGRAEALRLPAWDARKNDPQDSEICCLTRDSAEL